MKKKEKVEHILQLLSQQDRQAFKSYLKSDNLKNFYTAVLLSFTKNQGKILHLRLKKNNLDYSYNQLIERFYEFSLLQLSGRKQSNIRLNILAQYLDNPFLLEERNQYASAIKKPHLLEDYHNSFNVNEAIYFSALNETKDSSESTERLKIAENHLDIYYTIHKLRFALEKISRAYRLETNDIPVQRFISVDQFSDTDFQQHPILSLYYALYQVIYTYHQQQEVKAIWMDIVRQGIGQPTLEQTHKEFAINSLINFFNTQRPSNFHLEIHRLYCIAHCQKLLFQQSQVIYFSDISNLISSSINCKDIDFLMVIEQEYIPSTHHQESLIYLCQTATLLLSKQWILLAQKLQTAAPLPPIGLRLYYLIHLHIIKIKAAIESYIEQMDYAYELDFKTLIDSYQRLINRNTAQEKLPIYFKEKKLAFKQQLEQLIKTFEYTSKKVQKKAIEDWFQQLPLDTLYFTWLEGIYYQLMNKL